MKRLQIALKGYGVWGEVPETRCLSSLVKDHDIHSLGLEEIMRNSPILS
jgi:hypothetical protein